MRRYRPRTPSARNLAIHRAVVVDGSTQAAAGAPYGLTRSRVCQIIQSVERYASSLSPVERDTILRPERQLHLRNTFIEQLEHLRQQAMRE